MTMQATLNAQPAAAPADADRLITSAELRTQLGGVTPETLRRWKLAGKLPKPDVALSSRTQAWRLSTLRAAGLNLV